MMRLLALCVLPGLLVLGCSKRDSAEEEAATQAAQAFVEACQGARWDAALEHLQPGVSMHQAVVDGGVRDQLQEACVAIASPLDVEGARVEEVGKGGYEVFLEVALEGDDERFVLKLVRRGDQAYRVAHLGLSR